MLHPDVRIVPHEDLFRIYGVRDDQFVTVGPVQLQIAQLMDGRHPLPHLLAIAQRTRPQFTAQVLEVLVADLRAAGLLAEELDELDEHDTVLAPYDDNLQDAAPNPFLRVVRDASPAAPIPAPAPEPEAPEGDAIAAQEQAELMSAATSRAWHQRRWVRVLLVVGVLVGAAAAIPYPLRVTSDCTLVPSERVKVRSEISGILSEILVTEGQSVAKGEIVAKLDDRQLHAERLKSQAEIDKVKAELETLRQGRRPEEIQQQAAIVAARRNEVAFAAKEARRRSQMLAQGVGSRQAAEQATRDLAVRQKAFDEADAGMRLLKAGSRPEEITAKVAVLKGAEAQLAFVEQKLTMTAIRAPIAGTILTPHFKERLNEGLEAGGLVVEIANTSTMRAEILVPEGEADAIEVGMPAIVKVESFPTRPFEGKVGFIAPVVDPETHRLRAVVEIDNANGLLKANMTGYGEIEAGKRSVLALATRRAIRWVRVRFLI